MPVPVPTAARPSVTQQVRASAGDRTSTSVRSRTGTRDGVSGVLTPSIEISAGTPSSAHGTSVGTGPGSRVRADAVAQSIRTPATSSPTGHRASVPAGMSTGRDGNTIPSTVNRASR